MMKNAMQVDSVLDSISHTSTENIQQRRLVV